MIRLFVSDIDGTIVNEKSELEKETIEAIKDFQRLGGIFMLATGRNIWELEQFTSNIDGLVFNCANGSLLCDENGNEIISYALNEEKVRRFYEFVKKYRLIGQYHCRDLCATTESAEYFYAEATKAMKEDRYFSKEDTDSLFHRIYNKKKMQYAYPFEEILKHQVLKLEALFIDKDKYSEILSACNDYLSDCALAPKTFMYNIEISDIAAGKGKIIKNYCRIKGIREDEVAVVGDSANDIDMLKSFENSYVMGNARDEVKKYAKQVIEDNRNLGVYRLLRRIMKENETL